MNDNLLATGDVPGIADDVAVGVGGGQGELPLFNTESIGQSLSRNCCILGWKHQGDAFF